MKTGDEPEQPWTKVKDYRSCGRRYIVWAHWEGCRTLTRVYRGFHLVGESLSHHSPEP